MSCYSYIAVGATEKDYYSLAAPVGDRTFFAGEATEENYFGSVHGAHLTGLREAKKIADLVAS